MVKKSSNFPRINNKQITLVDLKLKEMLRKWVIKRTQPLQGEFLSNLFLTGKKRRRLSLCNQFKNVEPVHSFSPFQNERPFVVKALSTRGRLDVRTGSDGEGCTFKCPIISKLEEICEVYLEGDSLRVHVPMFWTRLGTIGVYKVIKNSNLTSEKNYHQIDNIFRRYFEPHNTRSSYEARHRHISPAKYVLFNNYKEINFAPMTENEISGNGERLNYNDFVTDNRKVRRVAKTFNTSGSDQGYGPRLSFIIQAVKPKNIQLIFPQKQKIVCLREK